VKNTAKKTCWRCPTKYSPLLKLAVLGFAGSVALANSPAMPQSKPSASPQVSQSATPKPSATTEPKKTEESTSSEDKKKTGDEKKQELPLPWVAAIVGSVTVGYLLVLWLRPRWLLLIPSIKTPKIGPIPEISPSVIHFFQYQPRVLDAWVSDRIEKAREAFDERETVKERNTHISMPVALDSEPEPVELTARKLSKICAKQEFRLLILGEGGAGKTHLACQLAKWAMAKHKEARLCQQQMLPVLIEEELEEPKENSTSKSPLLNAIARQLKNLRDEEKPIPEELLKKLLEKRRVLVIVDHLSEMSEATHKLIRLKDSSFPINALVVTSRLDDILGKDVTHTKIKPIRVNSRQLSIFMDDYLKAKGKRDLFEDDQYFEYLRRLSLIVTNGREITLLFAKLYAEQMIAVAEGRLNEDLPKNVPDLMLSYVNELNRNVQEGKLQDAIVHQALRLIAWECVRQTFKPETAKRQVVLTQLVALLGEREAAKETAEQQLKYLDERRFIRTEEYTVDERLSISLDPLAEYLAGLYLVKHYRNDAEAWRKFLAEAAEKTGTLEEIRGFLLAVRDCCLVKGAETEVPDFVAEELGRLAELDLETLEQEQLNRRIRTLISDLSRQHAKDRVHAAEALGEIGIAAKSAAIPIVKLLSDGDSDVRYGAAEALGKLGNASEPVLKELLTWLAKEKDDLEVRRCAAEALGELGNASEPVLKELLTRVADKEDDLEVRCRAAEALGKLGNASEPVLKELLARVADKEDDSRMRYFAAIALITLGYINQDVINALEDLSHDKTVSHGVLAGAWINRIAQQKNQKEID
jgi:HEAT repeat protein